MVFIGAVGPEEDVLEGRVWGTNAEEAAVVSGGAEVVGGAVGRGDVGGAVAMMGEVVVRMGEVVLMMRSETGSERGGGDGAIGSSVCIPSSPTVSWSVVLLEVSEAVVEAEALGRGWLVVLATVWRAFLAARSASLDERGGAGGRLRTPAAGTVGGAVGPVVAGISASMSSRSIGFLRGKKRK